MLRVFGIGSPHGDDQVGWRLVEALSREGQAGWTACTLTRPLDLVDRLEADDTVIVIDACDIGAEPGHVIVRPWPVPAEPACRSSSHGYGLLEAFQLAQVLGRMPRSVVLFLVQIGDCTPAAGLSATLLEHWADIVQCLRRTMAKHSPGAHSWRIDIRGRVQGVGFRPFVARLAAELSLKGCVWNTAEGVRIEVEGEGHRLQEFRDSLSHGHPPAAEILAVECSLQPLRGFSTFEIRPSQPAEGGTSVRVILTPDLAACPACLKQFQDPRDRRSGFALITCTDCGPRFSIQTSAPFDRERTTMADFRLCAECAREYSDPRDRRFHAQNTACPSCGPWLWLERPGDDGACDPAENGPRPPNDLPVLDQAAQMLRSGAILAVKGLGGFHLLCDATSEASVRLLRERKKRDRKPFAVLFADLRDVETSAILDDSSRTALLDPAAPIVLLKRREGSPLALSVAPGLNTVGAFLAYTPVHRALLRAAGRPLVATSGNETDEPMPIANQAARDELSGLCDALLLHNRRIIRHADDSVVRVIGERVTPLRVGRGLAPVRIDLPCEPPPILAVGGHMKAAIAFTRGRELFLGQHLGDLDTPSSRRRFEENVADLGRLLGVEPAWIAHDAHPEYFTTRYAEERGLPTISVQHHLAHILSCLAEHGERGPALGIAWDGTGYGLDGAIWGGEFLIVNPTSWRRFGSLWPFSLIGGDRAAREPRRAAAGVCHAAGLPIPELLEFRDRDRRLMQAALARPAPAQITTSAGRLFDAWAALLGLVGCSTYEAEAAMRLEDLADWTEVDDFPIEVVEQPARDGTLMRRLDWRGWVGETLNRLASGTSPTRISTAFHNALAKGSLEMAQRAGLETVVLSGGCFQNRFLSERTRKLLRGAGFRVLTHHRVPPGDGGLAVGQAWAAALHLTP